jgi:hypothetical protein
MTTKIESGASRKASIRGLGVILGASVLGALFSAQANAACMDPNAASGQGSLHQSPKLALNAPAAQSFWEQEDAAHKIVGTWQVAYATGGSVYGEGFIQWHSDGTEWENIDFPVLGGNICLGSWRAKIEYTDIMSAGCTRTEYCPDISLRQKPTYCLATAARMRGTTTPSSTSSTARCSGRSSAHRRRLASLLKIIRLTSVVFP